MLECLGKCWRVAKSFDLPAADGRKFLGGPGGTMSVPLSPALLDPQSKPGHAQNRKSERHFCKHLRGKEFSNLDARICSENRGSAISLRSHFLHCSWNFDSSDQLSGGNHPEQFMIYMQLR